ncbi:MAG: hypothetical protein FJ028_02375, partial [Chloroflexi bacterium]|nr:hypothetical protein [Chloroflexota bacterium]
MRGDRRAYLLILASRALSEAAALACLAAVLHAMTLGRDPLSLSVTTAALFGLTLVLVSILRERGTARQSAALVAAVMAGWTVWGMSQRAVGADSVAILGRAIGFGILGEVWLWRSLTIARGLQRWRAVRNDALIGLAAIVVAALVAGPIDRGALTVIALAVACAGAVALSLARSAEELSLATQVHGKQSGSSATGTAFALGTLAVAVAVALPSIESLMAAAMGVIGPAVRAVLLVILLPLGYLASYAINVILWLRERFGRRDGPQEAAPAPDPLDDLRRMRDMEELRPYVSAAVELLIGAVAVLLAALLVLRLTSERRALLSEGVSLERMGVAGIGLGATLRRLFGERAGPRRPPADDGT